MADIDLFYCLSSEVKDTLISFQRSKEFTFNVSTLNNIKIPGINKADINFNEILDPIVYGWTEDTEYPPLDWLSVIIASHLIGYKLTSNQIILVLNAITYHGFWGLFNIFNETHIEKMNLMDQFNYHKSKAKYFKGIGNIEEAQQCYQKTMRLGKKLNLIPYTLSLLSKLYSDYLQREGLCVAFSRIAFERTKSKTGLTQAYPRWLQICIDTYAKEIHKINFTESMRIFEQLLQEKNIHPLSYQRIRFRYLEIGIRNNIDLGNYSLIASQLIEYENLIYEIARNPRATYIRKIHFVGIFRELLGLAKESVIKDSWLVNRIEKLKEEEAESILDSCIDQAYKYRDKRFMALAYYEKSFWIEYQIDNENKVIDAIDCLNNGIQIFGENKKAVINRIYLDLLNRLAKLYVQNTSWDRALECYQNLYNYLSFLTIELEKDREKIENYLIKPNKKNQYSSEFNFLSIKEIKEIKSSLLIDYASLLNKLKDIGNNINLIQNEQKITFEEIVSNQKKMIRHDLKGCINSISQYIDQINNNSDDEKRVIIKKPIDFIKKEIEEADQIINAYLRSSIEESISPKEVDINKLISDFVTLYNNNATLEKMDVRFIETDQIYAKIPTFILRSLVLNLIDNAQHVGMINQIGNIKISMSLINQDKVIWLQFSDNCGDFDFFRTVINDLNNNRRIASKKNQNKEGDGLRNLRNSLSRYNMNTSWKLSKVNKEKVLTIPLYCYGHDT